MILNRAFAAAAVAALLVAVPVVAGVDVVFDPDTDFAKVRTYAWKTDAVVEAANAQAQAWIEAAVDRELQARGLRRNDLEPDIWVVTYAGTGLDVGYTAPYLNFTWSTDVHVFSAQDVTKGTLVISLIDPATDALLWRGIATRSINPRKLNQLRGKIEKATRDLFKQYPAKR